ncbi:MULTISPECIES: TRAP transporter small permease [unclassified Sporosarcina]|uniref:TRAP transporter small permease n=1 Tax=unclassified Sporosarcina TaxID=2647733 RepID=UPI00164D65B2|nr:TRAP transporter small permease [Sporosarcina sp. resist]QNK87433.1 TRAP transporter small permease [Sporosarcina sp. resist]
MEKIRSVMDKALAAICALLLAFMTVLATYQVITRYVFKAPSTMSEDMLSYSFVWVSLLGAALVFGQKDHMRLSLLSDKFKGAGGLILSIFTELLIIAIAVIVFLVGGKDFVGVGALQTSPTLNITMDFVYAILPLSGILIIIYNLLNIIQSIQKFNDREKEELQ